jgi:hypothetical protein
MHEGGEKLLLIFDFFWCVCVISVFLLLGLTGSVASLLASTLYQGNHDINHML